MGAVAKEPLTKARKTEVFHVCPLVATMVLVDAFGLKFKKPDAAAVPLSVKSM